MKITNFGKQIERLQAERGVSNNELAAKMGISAANLSCIKRRRKPHMITVHRLGKAFDVDVDIFLSAAG